MNVFESCHRRYRRQSDLDRHVSTCEGKSEDVSSVNRAMKFAHELIGNNEVLTYKHGRTHTHLKDVTVEQRAIEYMSVTSGWARGAKQGKRLKEIVYIFFDDIRTMWNRGNTAKGRKMSAAQMYRALDTKYPGRYDLPTEQHI